VSVSVAVIGVGSFGRNHLRVYRDLPQADLVAFVDADEAVRARLSSEYSVPAFATVEELLASGLKIEAASVCVPTVHHAEVAEKLLSAGVDTLIEKPIASTLAEADSVIALAEKNNRILQVGHLERFNPAVTAAFSHLNRPMFFESHRLSIFTPRSLDVDVVLDLMIHDLDVVLSLVPSPVREVRAVGLPVLSRKTDIANVRLEFENGCVANFTASRVSTERVRKLRFFQPHQYLSLDFARQDLFLIDVTAAASLTPAQLEAVFAAHQQNSDLQHPTPGLSLNKLPTEPGEPLKLELEAFLHAVETREVPRVTGLQGRHALALALEINAAIAEHGARAGLL
jgi:predicted dehydrogenase